MTSVILWDVLKKQKDTTHHIEKKVFVSRHAMFLENEILLGKDSESKIELDEAQEPQNGSN